MRLNTLIRRVEKVRDDMVLYVKAACEKEKEAIVDLNRAQLARGENAEGGVDERGCLQSDERQAEGEAGVAD